MVEGSSSDDNNRRNRGVNVRSDSTGVHGCTDTESSTATNSSHMQHRGNIKNEIQNVLDMMGQSTPTASIQNTGSEADNEDSVASIITEKRDQSNTKASTKHSARKPSSLGHQEHNSLLVDASTTSRNIESIEDEIAHSCCEHLMPPCPCHNPECLCIVDYFNRNQPHRAGITTKASKIAELKKKTIFDWIKNKPLELVFKRSTYSPCQLYKINISNKEEDGPPKRVVFDLVGGIPKPSSSTVATNTIRNPVHKTKLVQNPTGELDRFRKNIQSEETQDKSKIHKNIYYDSEGNTRVDFYYFDHGNSQYFNTTDTQPVMKCEIIAEKTERYTTKFWAEFFASIHIGVSFCVSFILQLFKFLLYSLIRPLAVGFVQLSSDYFFKPFLTTCFNGVIQPILIFLYNIATSIRDLCDPVAEAFGFFFREIAHIFRAIRLCTYKKNVNENNECKKQIKCEC